MTQYNSIKTANCSCINVQRGSGLQPYQCQCCATAEQTKINPPVCI